MLRSPGRLDASRPRRRNSSRRDRVLVGEIRKQIDGIWNDFWSGGLSNPLAGDRADHLPASSSSASTRCRSWRSARRRRSASRWSGASFPRVEGEAEPKRGRALRRICAGRASSISSRARCSEIVDEHVFPFIRDAQRRKARPMRAHMRDARFQIPTPGAARQGRRQARQARHGRPRHQGRRLRVHAGKIATAGQNGQFRTPRHIIAMMVELVAAEARGRDLRSGRRHLRLPGRGRRISAQASCRAVPRRQAAAAFPREACSTASTSTRPCCASAR